MSASPTLLQRISSGYMKKGREATPNFLVAKAVEKTVKRKELEAPDDSQCTKLTKYSKISQLGSVRCSKPSIKTNPKNEAAVKYPPLPTVTNNASAVTTTAKHPSIRFPACTLEAHSQSKSAISTAVHAGFKLSGLSSNAPMQMQRLDFCTVDFIKSDDIVFPPAQ
eukprot:TRINITY_DN37399_c0_g1_i1.p2 TRINITY_DN37399_c0_g1~~TRINITY_DN37399_c0_g1_i1.p2  ORF type:complete len:166 (-),score=27.01 TRINITY_DN37399_c0_g1_i1:21-518(-)